MQIQFITGDATDPIGAGNKIIAHVCNDIGAWGAGFVLAISKRWPQPEAEYLKSRGCLTLGTLSLIQVEPGIWVANMIAQRGIRTEDGVPPIRYAALRQCLGILAVEARKLKATIHMPRIGCGLAGGKWESVEPLMRCLCMTCRQSWNRSETTIDRACQSLRSAISAIDSKPQQALQIPP